MLKDKRITLDETGLRGLPLSKQHIRGAFQRVNGHLVESDAALGAWILEYSCDQLVELRIFERKLLV